jgi:diguanylate cyclase (GGDEF)-like protein
LTWRSDPGVPQSTDLPQKRVLIVDDSKFVRTTFMKILSASFAVREEADGEAGWHAIESDPSIVMVFTDLDMPKLTGFALLGRIRGSTDARIRDLPVVVISGIEEEGSKQRAREAGANDFIAKSTDAPELLSRLDNLLRLVRTSRELEASKQALDQTATHDPLTGMFTLHYLVTEGRKRYAHARRHGGQLSVMALRIDSYADVARAAGKDVADQVIARIAKLVTEKLRTEDSIARIADGTFMVIAVGIAAPQMLTLGQRLRSELDHARVTYGKQLLEIRSSSGVASLGLDAVNSIEELIRVALQRMQPAAGPKTERVVVQEQVSDEGSGLPGEIERALVVLERADPARLGKFAKEVLTRLQRIAKTIQAKRR